MVRGSIPSPRAPRRSAPTTTFGKRDAGDAGYRASERGRSRASHAAQAPARGRPHDRRQPGIDPVQPSDDPGSTMPLSPGTTEQPQPDPNATEMKFTITGGTGAFRGLHGTGSLILGLVPDSPRQPPSRSPLVAPPGRHPRSSGPTTGRPRAPREPTHPGGTPSGSTGGATGTTGGQQPGGPGIPTFLSGQFTLEFLTIRIARKRPADPRAAGRDPAVGSPRPPSRSRVLMQVTPSMGPAPIRRMDTPLRVPDRRLS